MLIFHLKLHWLTTLCFKTVIKFKINSFSWFVNTTLYINKKNNEEDILNTINNLSIEGVKNIIGIDENKTVTITTSMQGLKT